MKINNIGYLVKEGIRGIFLHGFMSFAAICVTVACLLIMGTFSCFSYNLGLMVEDLNQTNEVIVYIDDTYTLDKAKSVDSTLRRMDEYVADTEFVLREDALQNFINDSGNPELYDGVAADTLQHRVKVILKDNRNLEEAMELFKTVEGVAEVRAAEELATFFITMQEVVQIISFVVIVALVLVSGLIISNTVKIAMNERREEIGIMRMVGATNGFIRLPFVVESLILGLVGAGLAFGLQWLLYDAVAVRLNALFNSAWLRFVPFTQLLLPMAALFAFFGLMVGVVGSFNSIRKYMDV
jgi:cell division transport system permease protein